MTTLLQGSSRLDLPSLMNSPDGCLMSRATGHWEKQAKAVTIYIDYIVDKVR